MDDLIAKLRAALDEDERIAKSALGPVWVYDGDRTVFFNHVRIAEDDREAYPRNGAHIARHDPARVLRQVAAMRKLIVEYEDAANFYDREKNAPAGEVHGLRTALTFLAEAYESGR